MPNFVISVCQALGLKTSKYKRNNHWLYAVVFACSVLFILAQSVPKTLAWEVYPGSVKKKAQLETTGPSDDEGAHDTVAESADTEPWTNVFDNDLGDINQRLKSWQGQLDIAQLALDRLSESVGNIGPARDEAEGVREQTQAFAQALSPRLKSLGEQLKKLGEKPKEGSTEEPGLLAEGRERLTTQVATLSAAIKRAEQLSLRADQLISALDAVSRARFRRQIFERVPSLFSVHLWQNFGSEGARDVQGLSLLWSSWWKRAAPHYRLFVLFSVAVLIWFATQQLFASWSERRRDCANEQPPFFRRAASAARATVARAAPIIVGSATIYLGLDALDLLPPTVVQKATAIFQAIALYAIAAALAGSLIAPHSPQWRLIPFSNLCAKKVTWHIKAIAAVYAIAWMLDSLDRTLHFSDTSRTLHGIVLLWILVALLVSLLWMPWLDEEIGNRQRRTSRLWPAWIKIPLWLVAIAVFVSSLMGYIPLASFIAGQVILTATILQSLWLFHWAVRELVADVSDSASPVASFLTHHLRVGPRARRVGALTLGLVITVILIVSAAGLIFFSWGFSQETIQAWLEAAFFGFQVGSFQVSVARILVALALFGGVVAITRLFREWLDSRILVPPRVEAGLANSVRTVVGYIGIVIAAIVAVSYAGFDLTNIAIVAGALSVGIGFGLQSIVNNFVSGLILLVERPIKVGDWVIAGDAEGYVRSISVRSTEIETFDRAIVIVPNSELISGRVTNWTHRNTLGRVIINVGVSYSCDPAQVSNILLTVGRAHPKALAWPKPFVAFEDFGASSLDFSLRVYIADVNDVLTVRTELRIEVLKAFRESGIEIPFPQQDVHLRDLDLVKAAVARAVAERNASKSNDT